MSTEEVGRFRDSGFRLYDFAGEIWVVCPKCSKRAVVRPARDVVLPAHEWAERRMACAACGTLRTQKKSGGTTWGDAVDPFFRLPLWLHATCLGEPLWAYNAEHLNYLRRFVEASQRERSLVPPNGATSRPDIMSLVERLPAWLTSSKNRDSVLACIDSIARRDSCE